jgi:hypothetical protein
MTAVFIAPIIPWMIYNILMTKSPIFSFVYGIFWADQAGAEPFWYFMLYSPIIFSIFVLPIVYALVMSLKEYKHKEIQLLLILLILFLVYICFVCQHKEMRYILPIIPIFAVITGKYAARLKWKTIMMLAPLLLIPICQSYYMLDTEIYNCSEIITASQNLNGTVYSVFWPQTALYGDVKVIGPSTDVSRTHLLLHDTSILDSFISYDRSISYVIVDNDKYAPQNYINNFSFWDSQQYLHLEKQVNGTCFDVRVYKVIY